MKNNMTVVFIGFDGYSDMWEDCLSLYKKYWPDCCYRTLFVNNEKEFECDGIEILHAGKDAEWSKKVQVALAAIETQYICLLLEDFLVGMPIDSRLINDTISFIEEEGIRYYKLTNMSRAVKNRDPYYNGKKFLHVIPKNDEYGISLQAAIWETSYLERLLGKDNYNAWIFEFNRVKESYCEEDSAHEGCVFDERNIMNLQHGVIQSKYLPGTIKYFKKKGINLNIEREIMSYTHYFKLRLISKGKYLIPKSLRNSVKRVLEKTGMKFVSTERDKK